MSRTLLEFAIVDGATVSLARQRSREIGAALGMDRYAQVRMATAVSEIARNAHAHSAGGRVRFTLDAGPPCWLNVRVSDSGGVGARAPLRRPTGGAANGPADTRASDGAHGLEVVRRLADRFEVLDAGDAGRIATLGFELDRDKCAESAIDALVRSLPRPNPPDEAAELREANAALLASLGRAESAVSAREELLAIVSHDLRNPLGAIVASAEALEFAEIDAPARAFVDEMREGILASATRMEKLISDLLDLASFDAGTLGVEPATHDAHEIVRACARDMGAVATRRGIALVHGRDAGPELVCDRERVLQILSNLVGNAIKFSAAGGRVVLDVRRDGRYARFSVLDTGRGMTPEEVAHVFDRHWQRDGADRRGIGLGMSIVHALVGAHGGAIDIDSEPGAGTCVRVGLPLAGPPPSD